jgi:serine phosphatase RsbU (regulator of sigma subunit)
VRPATALTSVARHTIRAAAQHVRSPAEVLRWVHQAVLAYDPTTYCTACYGVLSVTADGRADRFEFALGGHAQPIFASAAGPTAPIGTPGTLLGMVPAPQFTNYTVELHGGDMLFLYTDGLTDAPAGEAVEADELVILVNDGRDGSPSELADRIRKVIDVRRPVGGGDDTALLIVKVS